jgi:hypothetical protein
MADEQKMADYWCKQLQHSVEIRNGLQRGLNRKEQAIQQLEAEVRGLAAENKRLRAMVAA